MKTFENGTIVKIQTPAGIVEGNVIINWRGVEVAYFTVRYNYIGSGYGMIEAKFSKKTGKPYGTGSAHKESKIIFE